MDKKKGHKGGQYGTIRTEQGRDDSTKGHTGGKPKEARKSSMTGKAGGYKGSC